MKMYLKSFIILRQFQVELGPMTIAMLLKNTLLAREQKKIDDKLKKHFKSKWLFIISLIIQVKNNSTVGYFCCCHLDREIAIG